MKQKLILVTFLFLFTGTFLIAQKSTAIIRGGINSANITITNDGDVDENNSITSFQAGVIADFPIVSVLSFQPGIIFTGKGSKTVLGDVNGNTWRRATTNPWYIEIPANFIVRTPTGNTKFFAGAGPYIAIGVAGKNEVEGKFLGTSFKSENDIEWSNDDPFTTDYEEGAGYGIMKRFDYGLNGTLGIEMTKAVLAVNYGFGLAKIQSGTNQQQVDDKNKHRVLSFTLGIKL
jgi:hypothetical protein